MGGVSAIQRRCGDGGGDQLLHSAPPAGIRELSVLRFRSGVLRATLEVVLTGAVKRTTGLTDGCCERRIGRRSAASESPNGLLPADRHRRTALQGAQGHYPPKGGQR